MPKLLLLDTSTTACTMSCYDGENYNYFFNIKERGHSDIILPEIDNLLKEKGLLVKDIDAICLGIGPGSFTGIRVATSIAQGLSFGQDIPILTVTSLEILANQFFANNDSDVVLSALDARMGEVYFSAYKRGIIPLKLVDESLSTVRKIVLPEVIKFGIGTGFLTYKKEFEEKFPEIFINDDFEYNHPQIQYSINYFLERFEKEEFVSLDDLKPLYVRNNVVS